MLRYLLDKDVSYYVFEFASVIILIRLGPVMFVLVAQFCFGNLADIRVVAHGNCYSRTTRTIFNVVRTHSGSTIGKWHDAPQMGARTVCQLCVYNLDTSSISKDWSCFYDIMSYIHVLPVVPTTIGKMGVHFPVKENLGYFEQPRKNPDNFSQLKFFLSPILNLLNFL